MHRSCPGPHPSVKLLLLFSSFLGNSLPDRHQVAFMLWLTRPLWSMVVGACLHVLTPSANLLPGKRFIQIFYPLFLFIPPAMLRLPWDLYIVSTVTTAFYVFWNILWSQVFIQVSTHWVGLCTMLMVSGFILFFMRLSVFPSYHLMMRLSLPYGELFWPSVIN